MRLVTRPDMDGLTCAVLITAKEDVDSIALIHPQEITEKTFPVQAGDILANVPYHAACTKWFDHHAHTATPALPPHDFDGAFGEAPSAARLVYEYYGGAETLGEFDELVRETDRLDAAKLRVHDVLDPQGYILLGFTIDGRTGLGPVDDYFLLLVDLLGRGVSIDDLLTHPAVAERCERMKSQNQEFDELLRKHSRLEDNVVITDFRSLDQPPVGNRFLVYTLYPEANVSVRLHWGPDRKHLVAVIGHSIFNRGCKTDVGELAARYGGGGHPGAGSIPLMLDAEIEIQQIVAELKRNG